MAVAYGVVRGIERRPDPKQPQRAVARAVFFLGGGVISPTGLVHARSLGSPALLAPPAPASLVHARALGDPLAHKPFPLALKLVRIGERLVASKAAHADSRAVFFLEATLGLPGALTHARALGQPTVIPNPNPLPLVHTRALGVILVSVPAQSPKPASLTRTRAIGVVTVASQFAPATSSIIHFRAIGPIVVTTDFVPPPPPPTYWHRSLRGVRRRARWG